MFDGNLESQAMAALWNRRPVLHAFFGLLELGAAVIGSGLWRATTRSRRASGILVVVCATVRAVHVLLSALYIFLVGGGVALSELLIKKVGLVGCVLLWLSAAPLWTDDNAVPMTLLPSCRVRPASPLSSRGSSMILVGRLFVSILCSAGGVVETRQLLFSPLTAFDPHDGHDEIRS